MKRIKQWLFPALTCLLVAGAAVLPQHISELKDAKLFTQPHTEQLDADDLPTAEPRQLIDRLALFAKWGAPSETVPSFQTTETDRELLVQALEHLVQAGALPSRPAYSLNRMERILLWDPSLSMSRQEPVEFWDVLAELGDGSMWLRIDGESGLPLEFSLYDPNMARWLAYKEPGTLPALAGRFFDLLGLEAEEIDPPLEGAPWQRLYSIKNSETVYYISFNATMLNINLERNGLPTYDGSSSSDG